MQSNKNSPVEGSKEAVVQEFLHKWEAERYAEICNAHGYPALVTRERRSPTSRGIVHVVTCYV